MVIRSLGLLYSLFAWTLFLLCLPRAARAQVGVTVCGCQPVEYDIRLQFNLTCQDVNVGGPGISETACVPSKETNEDVTDFVPVLVTNIQFLELNKDSLLLQQDPRTGDFLDGDTVRFTSVLAAQTSPNEATLPRALQMAMRGRNAADQQIQLTWVIVYSNSCGVVPVMLEGQKQGWSVFTELSSPIPGLCLNSSVTVLPSTSPITLSPMIPPSAASTRAPVELPTSFPTFYPASTTSPTALASIVSPSCSPSRPLTKGKGKGRTYPSTVMGKSQAMGMGGDPQKMDSNQYRGKMSDYGKMKMAMGSSMKKRVLEMVPSSLVRPEGETLIDAMESDEADEKLSLYYPHYYGDKELVSVETDRSYGELGPRELFRGDIHGQYRGMESSTVASRGCLETTNPSYEPTPAPVPFKMKGKKKGADDEYKGNKGGKMTTGSNSMDKGMYMKKSMSSRSKMGMGNKGKKIL